MLQCGCWQYFVGSTTDCFVKPGLQLTSLIYMDCGTFLFLLPLIQPAYFSPIFPLRKKNQIRKQYYVIGLGMTLNWEFLTFQLKYATTTMMLRFSDGNLLFSLLANAVAIIELQLLPM